MPVTELNEEKVYDFSGGYVDNVEKELLQPNQSPDLQNVYMNKFGELTSRNGAVVYYPINVTTPAKNILSIMPYYQSNGTKKLLFGVDNKVFLDGGAGTYSDLVTLIVGNTGLRWGNAAYVDKLFMCNGKENMYQYNGTTATTVAGAPLGDIMALRRDRLCVAGISTDPSLVHLCKLTDTSEWDVTVGGSSVAAWKGWVTKNDGDILAGMAISMGDLLLFKNRSIHLLQGTTADDFTLKQVSSGTGAVSPTGIVEVNNVVYFVASDGVYKWNGMVPNKISYAIDTLWLTLNKAYLKLAHVAYWNERLWVTVPEGSSEVPNLTLVYDIRTNSWWVWRGQRATCFGIYDSGTKMLLSGTPASSKGILLKQDNGTHDLDADGAAVAISAYWVSRDMFMDSYEHKKKFKRLYISDAKGTTNEIIAQYKIDDATSFTAAGTAQSDDGLVRRYGINSKGRKIAIKVYQSVLNAQFFIKGMMVDYKMKKAR